MVNQFIRKEFDFREPGHEWNAIISFLDEEPVEVTIYVWKVNEPWETTMEEDLSKALGYKVIISNMRVGNGHGVADLKRLSF